MTTELRKLAEEVKQLQKTYYGYDVTGQLADAVLAMPDYSAKIERLTKEVAEAQRVRDDDRAYIDGLRLLLGLQAGDGLTEAVQSSIAERQAAIEVAVAEARDAFHAEMCVVVQDRIEAAVNAEREENLGLREKYERQVAYSHRLEAKLGERMATIRQLEHDLSHEQAHHHVAIDAAISAEREACIHDVYRSCGSNSDWCHKAAAIQAIRGRGPAVQEGERRQSAIADLAAIRSAQPVGDEEIEQAVAFATDELRKSIRSTNLNCVELLGERDKAREQLTECRAQRDLYCEELTKLREQGTIAELQELVGQIAALHPTVTVYAIVSPMGQCCAVYVDGIAYWSKAVGPIERCRDYIAEHQPKPEPSPPSPMIVSDKRAKELMRMWPRTQLEESELQELLDWAAQTKPEPKPDEEIKAKLRAIFSPCRLIVDDNENSVTVTVFVRGDGSTIKAGGPTEAEAWQALWAEVQKGAE